MCTGAATNSREDLQLYSYEKSEAMPVATAEEWKVKLSSADPALQSIFSLHIDKPEAKRWITEYQNHKDNLPDDPTQVMCRQASA